MAAHRRLDCAETPEERAKIQARRMAGGYTVDDDERESNEDENG